MNAGAEFYLVQHDAPTESGEPVETEGGIFIPNEPENLHAELGKVISIGDYTTANIEIGDTVYFNKFATQFIKDDIYAVHDNQILAFE